MPVAAPPGVAPLTWTPDGHLAVRDRDVEVRFTTRRGGSSAPPFHSLHLGPWGAGVPATVAADRARVAAWADPALGPEDLAQPRQVHGDRVVALGAHDVAPGPGREVAADGVCVAARGRPALVITADCLPVVLVGDGAFAVVHAGWRGLAAGVLEAGLARLVDVGVPTSSVTAWLGPAAGPCCYRVGPEVHAAFADLGPDVRRGEHLDLAAAARARLALTGVDPARTHAVALCTICRPDLFFSHRRDGERTGRQGALAWRT